MLIYFIFHQHVKNIKQIHKLNILQQELSETWNHQGQYLGR